MPICKLCGDEFKCKVKIGWKTRNLKNRKYCLSCSPFKAHNTRKLKKGEKPGDNKRQCKICNRKYTFRKNQGHTLTKCNSCVLKERRSRIKKEMVEYKGNKCEKCGYGKSFSAMDFHHLGDKEFSLSKSYYKSWKDRKKELDKCILLCANCHREIHEAQTEGRLAQSGSAAA